MSWIPPDLSEACAVHTTVTTCQPQTFLFLQLVASLFGQSKDSSKWGFGYSWDYSNFFDHTLPFNGDNVRQKPSEYDFIVVGAGSAGCVVANRLTEVPHWRVLLLEAGDEEPEVASVPAFSPMLQRSSIDWNFMTQPSPHSCLARRNGQCPWVRGKVMGGSSTVNYMIYTRGHPRDYDEWSEKGNHGWSYREILPYFKKSEKNGNPEKVDHHYHGFHGYLSVEKFPYQDDNVWALLKAYEELGLPIHDQTGEHIIGASLLQTTSKNGRRYSTNVAYIRPIRKKRQNLVVETKAHVYRVLINPKTKIAYGVEYSRNGKLVQAIANKEVILSCGSIMSPKVLMLSGIGPSKDLEDLGIDVIKDLAVGYNLQDHTTHDGVVLALSNKTATIVDDNQQQHDIYYYREHQKGPLSATGTLQVNAFIQTKYEYEHDRPDIQISTDVANVKNFLKDPVLAAETNVNPLGYYDGIVLRSILLNPESRGVIKLNRSDPVHGPPEIYANTFYEQIDLLRIVEGIKQSLNLIKTKVLYKYGYSLVTEPMPYCDNYKFGTDEYWMCVITSYTATIYHFSGTCKMGPKDDHEAVVDPELRVHGFKNLRVIDASIMPKIVRGNTNAPTIMIAEKGSDLIKAAWLKDHDHYSSVEDEYFR